MTNRKPSAAVATYGDHEVITPENNLRQLVSHRPLAPGEEDPIARAEKAMAGLASEFGAWMDAECERLDRARRAVVNGGFNATNKDALFHAAHDIKGEAETFGYPAVAGAADSLCRLIEHTPDPSRIPLPLVDQHVDAVRAIYREYARSDAKELAARLIRALRTVTDEFLVRENRSRPDVLALIKRSPALAPE